MAEIDYAGDPDGADPGRRSWPAAVAVAVLGLVIGLLLGLAYSATEVTTYQATTSISVLPDPTLDFGNSGTTGNNVTQDATAFIQSQLVVVNGAELADRVRSELGLAARPDVAATQVGQTYVVSIVATAASPADAVRIAQRTATGYDAVRTRQLIADVDTLLAATNRQLTTVSDGLTAARRNARASDPLTPSQTALQTEYERLLSQRSSLTGVKAQAGRIVTVVAPARATSAGLSTTTRNSLIGALLGLLVGLGLFVVLRRSVRRIRTVADLSALGLVTILPVQSRRRGERKSGTAARLLAARLDPELSSGNALVFVGVTDKAGADRVASAVATALTDRGPVLYLPRAAGDAAGSSWLADLGPSGDLSASEFFALLVPSEVPGVWLPAAAVEHDGYRPTRVSRTARLAALFRQADQRGFTVVVEADPISASDMAVDCGRAGASIVLVVARNASTPADVVVATELFAAQSVTFPGAVLNEAPWWLGRLLSRPGVLVPRTLSEPTSGAHRDQPDTAEPEPAPDSDPDTDVLGYREADGAHDELPAELPNELLNEASTEPPNEQRGEQSGDRSDDLAGRSR